MRKFTVSKAIPFKNNAISLLEIIENRVQNIYDLYQSISKTIEVGNYKSFESNGNYLTVGFNFSIRFKSQSEREKFLSAYQQKLCSTFKNCHTIEEWYQRENEFDKVFTEIPKCNMYKSTIHEEFVNCLIEARGMANYGQYRSAISLIELRKNKYWKLPELKEFALEILIDAYFAAEHKWNDFRYGEKAIKYLHMLVKQFPENEWYKESGYELSI